MNVYHGSNEIVQYPDIYHSFRSLDFGKGFYVTSVLEQAKRWALRKSQLWAKKGSAIVNVYGMDDQMNGFKVKTFDDDLMEWIDFVCDCRDGKPVYKQYDIVIGKVADDRVFRVVDFYHSGVWDKRRALEEIRAYPNYDQIAFISQDAIDKLLTHKYYFGV